VAKTPADDERLSAELIADEKERAEHVMLVDLGGTMWVECEVRNCESDGAMKVEKYSHVLHIVSQVEGELNDGQIGARCLPRQLFPAGTMTGAPKIRAYGNYR